MSANPLQQAIHQCWLASVLTISTIDIPYITMQSIKFHSNTALVGRDRDRADIIATSKLKRAIDIAGAVVGLGITAILFVPIALALKLDSPGPILFRQTRVGLRGQYFTIWKFRSMVANAEQLKSQVANHASGHFFKNDRDPRITRFGSFLRKTSLDEFPQFLNVLLGDIPELGRHASSYDRRSRKLRILEWARQPVARRGLPRQSRVGDVAADVAASASGSRQRGDAWILSRASRENGKCAVVRALKTLKKSCVWILSTNGSGRSSTTCKSYSELLPSCSCVGVRFNQPQAVSYF